MRIANNWMEGNFIQRARDEAIVQEETVAQAPQDASLLERIGK